jgi:hypothetical protein
LAARVQGGGSVLRHRRATGAARRILAEASFAPPVVVGPVAVDKPAAPAVASVPAEA